VDEWVSDGLIDEEIQGGVRDVVDVGEWEPICCMLID